MTKEQEVELAYLILKKYQLPISPILEHVINECLSKNTEEQNIFGTDDSDQSNMDHRFGVDHDEDTSKCKAVRRKLRVEFPDGMVVVENVVADTLVKVVEKVGPGKIEKLSLKADGAPLVCREWVPKYQSSQREIDGGWKVCTHCSTNRKHEIIKEINNMLRLGLKVSFV